MSLAGKAVYIRGMPIAWDAATESLAGRREARKKEIERRGEDGFLRGVGPYEIIMNTAKF